MALDKPATRNLYRRVKMTDQNQNNVEQAKNFQQVLASQKSYVGASVVVFFLLLAVLHPPGLFSTLCGLWRLKKQENQWSGTIRNGLPLRDVFARSVAHISCFVYGWHNVLRCA